jgi:hypothetical protein
LFLPHQSQPGNVLIRLLETIPRTIACISPTLLPEYHAAVLANSIRPSFDLICHIALEAAKDLINLSDLISRHITLPATIGTYSYHAPLTIVLHTLLRAILLTLILVRELLATMLTFIFIRHDELYLHLCRIQARHKDYAAIYFFILGVGPEEACLDATPASEVEILR